MSAEQQARALMMRHHHAVKHRQQAMLERAASEIGVDVDNEYWTSIQGKAQPTFRKNYDRSHAALS
ncbi:MAG: hypothetical protein IGR93_08250 [Hydrococcus sp. C42_A2020_068]|uniref:hypothetical protein n=1 Tax=Pleurocapsa sp. PCC 7327 TaxID=118163 RepID=UPI00059D4914|nr:hypothetical protein [Pleurocapsa sp. PCC 7327]MBF2020079.1 hypothetical protein [Hydrococcus sp. C42_A2020_068]